MYKTIPAVFAVEDTYQIMVRTEEKSFVWVKIGDQCFYDHSNGILRSNTTIHRITVPSTLLDKTGQYTVYKRLLIERKPYYTETGEISQKVYDFYPVKGDKIRAYHIADAHNMIEEPVRAAQTYGKIDFLILNGDIASSSDQLEDFDNVYELCGRITHGNIPVVFARGNHDMRGKCAEYLEYFTPVSNGKSYYTVRLGDFFAIILDCGEDKADDNAEYGNTICCHAYREEETGFLEQVMKSAEYWDKSLFCRAVIVHNPFIWQDKEPFDIENDIYNKWTQLLCGDISPDIIISGHTHKISIGNPGDERDYRGQPCPIAVLSELEYEKYFAGAGIEFNRNGKINITVTDSKGQIRDTYNI